MALQPLGPLPASTYWRRRLLLLVGVLLLVLVGFKACDATPRATSAARSSASPHPSTPAPRTLPTTRAAVPKAPTAAAAPLQLCRDAVLQIDVTSDAASYPAGASPRFTLTVRNIGSTACRRALGPGAVELRVFSGEDRIWSSDDCSSASGQGVQTLPAGAARATTAQWPGKRTRPGCDIREAAQPGTYRVSARVGTVVLQGSVFRFTG
jgi:hypothetical protein